MRFAIIGKRHSCEGEGTKILFASSILVNIKLRFGLAAQEIEGAVIRILVEALTRPGRIVSATCGEQGAHFSPHRQCVPASVGGGISVRLWLCLGQ